MTNNDLNFVLSILRGQKPCLREQDWFSIFGFLAYHRISVFFFNRANSLNIVIPQPFLRKLIQQQAFENERILRMKQWAQDISYQLTVDSIPHAILKGLSIQNLYKEGERSSNDIDVLVHPKNLEQVERCLTNLGFKPGYWDFKNNCLTALSRSEIISRRMNRGETAPFMTKADSIFLPFVEVDLNFSLDYLPTGKENQVDQMLSNTEEVNKIKVLNAHYNFIHLLLHQYKESTVLSMVKRGKDLELYKFIDLVLYIKSGVIDINKVYQLSKKLGVEREVNSVFYDLKQFDSTVNIKASEHKSKIIDPENNFKEYYWQIGFLDRLKFFNRTQFLLEV